MTEQQKSKILLAYDGSDLSLDAVQYIGRLFPSDRTEIVIFYVETQIPRSFWHMEKELDFRYQTPEIRASMAARKKEINLAMEKATKILLAAGFPLASVRTKIYGKNQGIVQDIVEESHQGYDALVIGRKGHSRIKDFLVDSVPVKLLGKIKNIPLIVVGKKSSHKNILVAFDGTREIMKAVKQMSSLINISDCKLLFAHSQSRPGLFQKEERKDPSEMFDLSVDYFLDAGFSSDQVSFEVVADGKTPTECILNKARSGDFDTIVTGRRGLNKYKNLISSRVGNKIFRSADDFVVWVVQ